jgi:CBS domain-containing protein
MATKIRQVMVPRPVIVRPDCTVTEAAQLMRDGDIGDVIVQDGPRVAGILTDRDIVIRAVADDRAPADVTVGEICSADLLTVGPEDPIDRAVQLMREGAIRRLPVAEDGRVVGIITLGDLAIERDEDTALADISAAEPNI